MSATIQETRDKIVVIQRAADEEIDPDECTDATQMLFECGVLKAEDIAIGNWEVDPQKYEELLSDLSQEDRKNVEAFVMGTLFWNVQNA